MRVSGGVQVAYISARWTPSCDNNYSFYTQVSYVELVFHMP